jgi:hypothetical protein
LLATASAVAGVVAEVPFEFRDGFILVKVQAPQARLTFLVDSGAGRSVIGLRAARRLKLPLGRPQRVLGVNADAVAYETTGFAASLGGVPLHPHVLALDLRNAHELCGAIDGLIGIDFFAGRVVQIDYATQHLRMLDRAPAPAESVVLPLQAHNGVVCVPVSVEGSERRWTRLDSGCNDALHWVEPGQESREEQRAVSIGFFTDRNKLVRRSVALGGQALPEVKTAMHGREIFPGEAGLLGNGLLSRFATVTIDLPKMRVILTKRAGR